MNLALAVCGNFEPEVRLVIEDPEFRGVDVVTLRELPPTCGRPLLTAEALRGACAGLAGCVEVIGGACCAGLTETCDRCTVHRLNQCFYLVAPATLVDHYLSTGAYLVTPGWLARWRARVEHLGIDAAAAPAIFGESARRVVLLDTGAVSGCVDALREFAAFVALPAEIVPVGPEHIRLYLAGLVSRRRLEVERAESLTALSLAHRRSTDFAAAFDLLGTLTEIAEEKQVIQRSMDVFSMLFAPTRVTVLSVVDGAPAGVVSRPPREVDPAALFSRALHEGNGGAVHEDGFLLPIKHLDQVLGLVEVEGIAVPDHRDRDLVLALSIAAVCGLAISNAREYERIKRAETETESTSEFLRLVNAGTSVQDVIQAAVSFFREKSGCEAVGVRLREGDDFPYYEARGFPREFLLLENQLCVRDAAGDVCRDRIGNPVIECMCGNVISGRVDPRKPFFTAGGTFWTNSTTRLLATTTPAERQGRTRNRCNGEGYESVALIPLRVGQERLGLLQLNDRRQGMFTPEGLALWERCAGYLSVAVAKARADGQMCASEARLRLLSHTAGRLLAAEDPQALVDEICREVMGHLDCQVFFNFLVDDSAGRLHLNSCAGIPAEEARTVEWLDYGEAVCGRVARDQQRIVAEDILNSSDRRTSLVKWGVQAYACHPLLAQGRLLGTLAFGTRTRARFSPDEVELMRTVSDQVATALEREQAQQALRAANSRLVDADRRKNDFLAMLSHELRNPLAPIRNSVYILERAAPAGEQATRAREVIDRQAQQMTRLIDDLLDVTRISRGKIRLQRERVELNRVVRGTGEDLREVFCRKGVELQVMVTSELLFVDGDPTRLAQMIGNLLQNAAKFTHRAGHAFLTLELGLEGEAVIQVRDDGAGIQRELLSRLFEPFVQADRTLDRSAGGLGLGLALVKGLAELHGGRVSVQSEGPGKGARFTIRLPLDAPVKPRLALGTAAGRTASGTRRVLVIEDNADSARSLEDVLVLDAHLVEVAHAGQEGIEKARAFRPDVIVCDIGLPGMDGYAVARAIRADAALRSIFLVALTGYAGAEDIERSQEAGFDLHMAKPPDVAALEKVLSDLPAHTSAS